MPGRQRMWKTAGAIVGWPALLIGAYFLASWAGSSLPASPGWSEPPPGPDTVEIMVATNGVHTTIVMPRRTQDMDWTSVFPPSDLAISDAGNPNPPYTHVAISWGQREVFIETPTWADLSPLLALRVAVAGGDALLHVEHFVRPAPSDAFRPLRITREQYRALVKALQRDLPAPDSEGKREIHPGYGYNDLFYAAKGRYTLIETCNAWTGQSLATAGLPTGRWTPFASSVMKWIERPTGT